MNPAAPHPRSPDPHSRTLELAAELLALLDDPAFRRSALPPANFWSVVHYGEASYENRYNRVVRWLLDPAESHGLGAAVVNELIARIHDEVLGDDASAPAVVGTRRVRTRVETPVPTAVLTDDRELEGRIDVTLVDHDSDIVVAVESKLRSAAHDEQLSRYRTHIDTEYSTSRRHFVFLTETGEEADDEGWYDITYREFAALVDTVRQRCDVSPAATHLIDDFIADIHRRAADPTHRRIGELFFADADEPRPTQNRYADLLACVAEDLEPDPEEFAKLEISRLGAYLTRSTVENRPDAPSRPADVFETLEGRFDSAGLSTSDLVRVLTYVIEHAPRVRAQNHDVRPGIREFFLQYVALLTGVAATTNESRMLPVLPHHSADGYLRHVELNRRGKGVTFNADIPGERRFRVAGNDIERFPWWVAHLGVTNATCGLIGSRVVKRRLEEWTVEDFHAAIVAALASAAADAAACGCGEALSQPRRGDGRRASPTA